MVECPLGVNGGEFPHWSVAEICDLTIKLGGRFVELSSRRLAEEGIDAVALHARSRGLAIHVNAAVSELPAAFAAAWVLDSPFIVAFDDAIERVDASRRESLEAFRRTVIPLLEQPDHAGIRVALENSFTRSPGSPRISARSCN